MQILPLTTMLDTADAGQIAERRLRESPYFFLRRVRCEFHAGVLTLRGQVPFGQLKQFAEAIVSRVDGVQHIVNAVEVRDPAYASPSALAMRNAG